MPKLTLPLTPTSPPNILTPPVASNSAAIASALALAPNCKSSLPSSPYIWAPISAFAPTSPAFTSTSVLNPSISSPSHCCSHSTSKAVTLAPTSAFTPGLNFFSPLLSRVYNPAEIFACASARPITTSTLPSPNVSNDPSYILTLADTDFFNSAKVISFL